MELGDKWKKWKTTVMGVIGAILMVLVMMNVITATEKQEIDEITGELATHVDTLAITITAIVGLINSLIAIFRAE